MKFKDDVIAVRFDDMNKLAKTIATDMDDWSQANHGIELTLTATTSTLDEDKILGRVSDTHRTRRAFDVRQGNLPEEFITALIEYTNKKYGKYGAVASSIPQLIVNKPHGTGPHLHIQLNRKYALAPLNYGAK